MLVKANTGNSKEWAKLLKTLGVSFAHQWTAEEFAAFIQSNGWKINKSEVVPGRIDLVYAECVRLKKA